MRSDSSQSARPQNGVPSAELRGEPGPARGPGSLPAALEQAAALDAPFLCFHDGPSERPLAARAALSLAMDHAAELRRCGVCPGDRVLIVTPSSPEFVGALFGCMLLGAVPVPLASPMTFGSLERYLANLRAVRSDCGAKVLVTTRRILKAMADDPVLAGQLSHAIDARQVPARGPQPLPLPSIDGRTTALLQYTSGTTGVPKGVMVSQAAVAANTAAIAHALDLTDRDVGVSWLPLFHDMGLIGAVLTTVFHPFPMHLLTPERFVMNPDSWMQLVAAQGATVTVAPNFGYEHATRRARKPPPDLHTLRACLNGAEPVQPATIDRFCEYFGPGGLQPRSIRPVYGMAENTLAVSFEAPNVGPRSLQLNRAALERDGLVQMQADGPNLRHVVSVGTPVAGVQVRIADDDGCSLPQGRVGPIQVGGDSLMDGYYGRPELNQQCLSDGWLRTGDLGFIHQGQLYITGRSAEMIIKAGRNLYPADLEHVAAEVTGVLPAAVAAFGAPNAESGTDDIVVMAESRESDPDVRELIVRNIVGNVLAELGVKPDRVELRPPGSLPRTTSGKIQRGRCASQLPSGAPQ